MSPEEIYFSLPEILSLFGLVQCLLIMAYMLLRAGKLSRATLPFVYFLILGGAFALDFGDRNLANDFSLYPVLKWFFWFSGPPLSVLLIIQIAQITRMPALRYYWVLFLIPMAFVVGVILGLSDPACVRPQDCPQFMDWLLITGLVAGASSLLMIWINRNIMDALQIQHTGQERFWLVLSLIVLNILFLCTMLGRVTETIDPSETLMLRTVLGLAFVYIASTSLFRIYPPAIREQTHDGKDVLSDSDIDLAMRIERLLEVDKVYQEPSYSRADMARELSISESVLSRVINLHFQKSFPQILNEHRVEDAKRLLRETRASVQKIAEESGFNSIASFNRVFKDMSGVTPSAYRKK